MLCSSTWLQGRLENLRLGNMGLTGTLPACLFNGNSSLYQVGDGGLVASRSGLQAAKVLHVDTRPVPSSEHTVQI